LAFNALTIDARRDEAIAMIAIEQTFITVVQGQPTNHVQIQYLTILVSTMIISALHDE
jgi:hypothetical protein